MATATGRTAVSDRSLYPLGVETITGLSSAKGLTVPTGAVYALIAVETKAIRWRDDGTNPTAATGMPQAADTERLYTGDLSAIKLIEQSASAAVTVAYYGVGQS